MSTNMGSRGFLSLVSMLLLLVPSSLALDDKANLDLIEDRLAAALADELSSISDQEKDQLMANIQAAASQIREEYYDEDEDDYWSSSVDDENDLLHSRDDHLPTRSKRDDYYDGLEMKSRSSGYHAPRKTFYARPELEFDSSEEEPVRSARTSRTVDSADDYYPSGSRHRVDSLAAIASNLLQGMQLQTPPWRFQPGSPAKPSEPQGAASPQQREGGGHQLPRAAVAKSHGTYTMVSSQNPRRPPVGFVANIRHTEGAPAAALRSGGQSKQWVSESPKAAYAPKMPLQRSKSYNLPMPSVVGYGKKGTRQQFHEQGVHGPNSYKFGYSTGDQENPMARYEERSADGVVRGSYSYVDPMGKKQVVHYQSHPKLGFSTNHDPK